MRIVRQVTHWEVRGRMTDAKIDAKWDPVSEAIYELLRAVFQNGNKSWKDLALEFGITVAELEKVGWHKKNQRRYWVST
jgi:hypothetical protein